VGDAIDGDNSARAVRTAFAVDIDWLVVLTVDLIDDTLDILILWAKPIAERELDKTQSGGFRPAFLLAGAVVVVAKVDHSLYAKAFELIDARFGRLSAAIKFFIDL